MGRVNTPTLTLEQRQRLESGLRQGKSHCYRMRCQSILLKSEGRSSEETGRITGMSEVTVNNWLKRFKSEGISGLQTKSGRGRKPIIDEVEDKSAILSAIQNNRQRLMTAKAEWEASSGKSVCRDTFRTFLKRLADDINV
jgi:transposase